MGETYGNVIVDIAHEKVDRVFQYKIPEELAGQLEIGMQVKIPFGSGNRIRSGYLIELTDIPTYDPAKTKQLLGIMEKAVPLESNLIKLAYFIKENYGSTMIRALKTVLPVKQKMKRQEKRSVRLLLTKKEAEEKLVFYEARNQKARGRLLRELIQLGELPYELITGKLNVSSKTVQVMQEQGVLAVKTENTYRNPIKAKPVIEGSKRLSVRQQAIVDEVLADDAGNRHGAYLLHGVTGSGKTEVYMEIIAGMISCGKQSIVLIPEIALTYQTVMRFQRRFGDRVSIMNSKLSQGERYDQMERARNGELDVIIGPRSALFAPFPQLGLIVIDEEHENTYKSEAVPKYHAREVAMEIARMQHASVVLGSATPSLESYYQVKQGHMKLYVLTERLTGGTLPHVQIVDLREELKSGNRSIFSRALQELLQERLQKGQQSMLFLNRRGYAGFISCRSCGHVMKCPHCDVSLSEHKNRALVCHYCGYEEPAVKECPCCGSKYILGFRAGTQQIEELLQKEFPAARVLRMDADTTKNKDSYEEILSAFANQEADILIGTQMIVKGHDFPNVTLVGILAADLSLAANDYRAGERTFQLLTQAAGRAGRGSEPGEVVIQTYQPEHYSIVHAANQDYRAFYEEEIMYRELLQYPPAAHMMAVQVMSLTETNGLELADELAQRIRHIQTEDGIIIGPAAAGIGKIKDVYRFIIYLKQKKYEVLVAVKNDLELYLTEKDLKNEMVHFDFDPMNTY